METLGVIVFLVAALVPQVFAEEALGFPEDVQRMSGARIVSGWDAEEGQIPWQLSLRMVNPTGAVNACGGSIIHHLWGMTAAHCTATRVTMVIRAGAVSLTRPELLFETTEYYNHPQYIDALQTVVQPNDIALLKFPRAITFSERVQPIRIQRDEDRDRNYAGIRLEASGWGRTWTNGPAPEDLQWVYLTGDSNLACWIAFGGSSIIQDSTICASAYNVSSQSTCQGDSGGPLVELGQDGKYTLVGVASFVSGAGCHADFPAGFIRPGHYHSWYREVTQEEFDWDYEEPTTVAPTTTTEAASSSSEESEEVTTTEAPASSSSSESSSEESQEVTTTEAPASSSESSSEESEEVTTTQAPESSSESSSEESQEVTTTEAPASSSESSSEESQEVTTTEAPASSSESSSEESQEVTTTEAPASSSESSSEESEEVTTTQAPESSSQSSSEESQEVTTTEAPASSSESSSEESEEVTTTQAPASSSESSSESDQSETEVEAPEEVRSVFTYFRSPFARFQA